MSVAGVLDAVPMQDTLHLQHMQAGHADQGRNYSYMFNFEQEFEHSVVRAWMEDNWRPVCAWASGVYLLLIFSGQSIMTHRQPFQLRGPLTAWNIILAVFSMMGAARTLPEFIYTFSTQGFHHSLCVPSFIERDRVSGFWTWMFVLSKVPELGDTIFIVLRKQRLIFLHWYHHVTVLIYCWYSFSEYTAPARWFVVMNFAVHSLMYTYYAFRALRFRIPQYVAMVITTLQLVQMVVGCTVNYIAYTLKRRGVECGVSNTNLQLSLLMYTSYFVLFARFFYNTYFRRIEKGRELGKIAATQQDKLMHLKEMECDRLYESKPKINGKKCEIPQDEAEQTNADIKEQAKSEEDHHILSKTKESEETVKTSDENNAAVERTENEECNILTSSPTFDKCQSNGILENKEEDALVRKDDTTSHLDNNHTSMGMDDKKLVRSQIQSGVNDSIENDDKVNNAEDESSNIK